MHNPNDFIYIITYIIGFLLLTSIIIIVFIVKAKNKIIQKELQKKNLEIQFQKEILQKTILTQEKERKRIAQDLHDDVSSKLIAVSLNLHLLKSAKTKEESKVEIIDNISIINQNTIETSRKIAHHLFPPVLDKFGLAPALEELVDDYNKTKSVTINYFSEIVFDNQNKNSQLQIFRIIQELISNSIKHGKAAEINIKFTSNNLTSQCIYTDNGIGFEIKTLQNKKGLGFSNIESRIQNIDGDYAIKSSINNGFQFIFTF